MYEDWVIVSSKQYPEEHLVCVAPRWSRLKQGDLVKVEGWSGWLGVVEGCITVNSERDEDLIQFITYLIDDTPRIKIVSKYREEKFEYDNI